MSTLAKNLEESRHVKRRYARERRFRFYGQAAIVIAGLALLVLLGTVVRDSWSAFRQAELGLDISESLLLQEQDEDRVLKRAFFEAADMGEDAEPQELLFLLGQRWSLEFSRKTDDMTRQKIKNKRIWITLSDDSDFFLKNPDRDQSSRLSSKQREILLHLQDKGQTRFVFAESFFTNADSREPEYAGLRAALVGSLLTLFLTLLLSFPIGLFAGIYLEAFAPKNRLTDFIELNVNNLASVPSIIFGLLGLQLFLNIFGLPRSTPLVGGIILALMTFPVIIIATRASLASVPPQIRQAALALGASETQSIFHHVVPLAFPGIITGSIIGMARAIGETAPLLMIGMVAFIASQPGGFTSPATVLPVQIYIWFDSPERAFAAKASAAILLLLLLLFLMSACALYLRKRYEKRW